MPNILRASVFFMAVASLLCGLLVEYAVSEINTAQVQALWKDYVVAEKRLQFDIAKMLSREWPEMQSVAGLERDQQFALIELQNLKFQYLMVYDPDRIVYDDGLSRFTGFEWKVDDSEALRDLNPDFGKLERWADLNAKRLAEHPDQGVAERRLSSLRGDERFRLMMDRYQERMDDLEAALQMIDLADKRTERNKVLKSQIGR
ncbi:MAG: hypothetical protein PVF33_03590 [Candidatus Latescibacterota bacterium]|jgi:hypothetical protein